MSHTRELAFQTAKVVKDLGAYTKVKVNTSVGGISVEDNIKELRDGCHVVVGTPGRVIDMMLRKVLVIKDVKTIILDEADELLSRGFKQDMYDIISTLPENVQICIFSATFPPEILDLSKSFTRDNVVKILMKKEELTLEGIKQYYVDVNKESFKFETLVDLYNNININQAIIYVNERSKVDTIYNKLKSHEHSVSCIHAGMAQEDRMEIMKSFRCGKTRILLTTDLLSRGIDVQQVSLVVNYDLPSSKENYIHRIGRSGRFGRKGIAINFVTYKDVEYLRDIEQFYATAIVELPPDLQKL